MDRDQECKASAGEKKRVLEACKPRKFSTLTWTAERIAEIAEWYVTDFFADCVVGTFNLAILWPCLVAFPPLDTLGQADKLFTQSWQLLSNLYWSCHSVPSCQDKTPTYFVWFNEHNRLIYMQAINPPVSGCIWYSLLCRHIQPNTCRAGTAEMQKTRSFRNCWLWCTLRSCETQLKQVAATKITPHCTTERSVLALFWEQGFWLLTALLLPVSLRGKRENSLGSTGPTQQAASTEVKSSALTALLDEFLDRNWLDDGIAAEGRLLLRGHCLGRLPRVRVWVQPSRCLLWLGDSKGGLRSTVAEVGVLQRADVLTHPENKQEKQKMNKTPKTTTPPPTNHQAHWGNAWVCTPGESEG